jgi:prophage regulatory protein
MSSSKKEPDFVDVERLLSLAVVAGLIGFSRVYVMQMAECGRFPRPIRVGTRRIAFKASEVQAWIDARERAWRAPAADAVA